jgi:spermidine synthase
MRPPSRGLRASSRRIFLLFAITIFLSALLLFWIQLTIAKMLLPRLGGTPAVWNTCMLFFQILLLAGYSYVLVTTSWMEARKQAVLHTVLLLLSCLYLPLTLTGNAGDISEHHYPALWLFAYLLSAIGLPIFLISTTSPLLQKWFTHTGHEDPYFLFAVSNAGSLLALISYPVLLEPNLKLSRQTHIWAVAYVVFLVLSLGCMLVLWKSSRAERVSESKDLQKPSISLKQRLYWILLAFIPASLLFGVTTYITTEIAPTPLLWTIPLALYLVTFVLAFAGKHLLPAPIANAALGALALLLTLVLAANATEPTTAIVLLHLCFFFVAATICHNKLAGDRPSAARLADFYLCVAIGGMLGGLFNTLIAPIAFNTIIEYPLAIVLACLVVRENNQNDSSVDRLFDVIWPAIIGALIIALVFIVKGTDLSPVVAVAIIFGAPLVIINHRFRTRPVRFALALGAVMLGSVVYSETQNRTLHVERNFFGTLSVKLDHESGTRILYHGNTIHGRQFINPVYQTEPLSYFHREGPLGLIFDAFNANAASPNVAVVGLGTGSMLCYSFAGQRWTFYEINPAVVRLARTPEYFTYLEKCAAAYTDIVVGDARLKLQNAPDQLYGLIVLDAFNSDAIPVHLLTQEAIDLYMSKLATGGMLAFHISNRSLRLDGVLADLAEHNGAMSLSFADGEFDPVRGKDPSEWLVMARNSPAFDSLAQDPRWRVVQGRIDADVWTDDFSNILRVFRWY